MRVFPEQNTEPFSWAQITKDQGSRQHQKADRFKKKDNETRNHITVQNSKYFFFLSSPKFQWEGSDGVQNGVSFNFQEREIG